MKEFLCIFATLFVTLFAADGDTYNSTADKWESGVFKVPVSKGSDVNCIIIDAKIRLDITYDTIQKNDTETKVYLPVMGNKPGDLQINLDNSSCYYQPWSPSEGTTQPPTKNPSTTTTVGATTTTTAGSSTTTTAQNTMTTTTATKNTVKPSDVSTGFQRIEFTFWDDWKLGLVFTNNDSAMNFGDFGHKAFVLYSVDLSANLKKLPNNFKNVTHYSSDLFAATNTEDWKKDNYNTIYWKQISAVGGANTTFKCRLLRLVRVTDRLSLGLVNLTMVAFSSVKELADLGNVNKEENCPQRIPMDKPIDIIIGSIMSGIVTIVMFIYPVYRYKRGPSRIPKHLLPKPPKNSVSTVDGHHLSVTNSK